MNIVHRLPPVLLVAVAVVMLPVAGAPPTTRPATRGAAARPTLALAYDAVTARLTVTLRNDTGRPIRVDRELVIPLELTFHADAVRRDAIALDDLRDPRAELGTPDVRFATVPPGGTVDRVIPLGEPIRTWTYGHYWLAGEVGHRPYGAELYRRLPDPRRVTAVSASYNASHFPVAAGFRAYAGTTFDDLGVFKGPISAELRLTAQPATAPGATPRPPTR